MDPATLMMIMQAVGSMAQQGQGQQMQAPQISAPAPVVAPPPTPFLGGAMTGRGPGAGQGPMGITTPNFAARPSPPTIPSDQLAQIATMPPAQALQLAQMHQMEAQRNGAPHAPAWNQIIQRMMDAKRMQDQTKEMGAAPGGMSPQNLIMSTLR